jgi:hypothetical protein
MSTRDPAAERYNRRTRAIERQADAMQRIASAAELLALAATTSASVRNEGRRIWSTQRGSDLMAQISRRAKELS